MSQTVTEPTPYERTVEMSVFGWIVAIGVALVLVPLLPVILVLWLLSRTIDAGNRETAE
ncbi:DUF7535 family protein [Natrialbaceae archaeon A-gly3]